MQLDRYPNSQNRDILSLFNVNLDPLTTYLFTAFLSRNGTS